MENCDLELCVAGAFQKPAGSSKTILIAGRLEKREEDGRAAKLVFVVSDLQFQPSDSDRYKALRAKVSSNKPDEWYKLADWGAARAKFYRDEDLKREATLAFKSGVQAEHRALNPMTAASLRKLATSWRPGTPIRTCNCSTGIRRCGSSSTPAAKRTKGVTERF